MPAASTAWPWTVYVVPGSKRSVEVHDVLPADSFPASLPLLPKVTETAVSLPCEARTVTCLSTATPVVPSAYVVVSFACETGVGVLVGAPEASLASLDPMGDCVASQAATARARLSAAAATANRDVRRR